MIQAKVLVVTTFIVAVVAVSVAGSTMIARPVYALLPAALNDLLSQPMQLTPAEKQQLIKEVREEIQSLTPQQKQAAISHLKMKIQSLPAEVHQAISLLKLEIQSLTPQQKQPGHLTPEDENTKSAC